MDRATPNLPSADFDRTEAFYSALGFTADYRGTSWMILTRDGLTLEFFPMPIDPRQSSFGACLRVGDLEGLFEAFAGAGLSRDPTQIPRLGAIHLDPSGLRMFYALDPDGSLLRCIGATPQPSAST